MEVQDYGYPFRAVIDGTEFTFRLLQGPPGGPGWVVRASITSSDTRLSQSWMIPLPSNVSPASHELMVDALTERLLEQPIANRRIL